MIKTPLTRWFDLTTPIIGAPMAGVAGGALARAAWRGFLEAASEIAEHGTFTALGRAVPFAEIERRFRRD